MAYNENIPQATDNPSQSQGQMLDNFQEISTAFNTNHGNFNAGDQGKHSFLQMPEQSSPPTTLANEAALFSQNSSLTNMTELVFRRESNGDQIEFTGFLGAANGWTRIASGILLKWGTGSGNGSHTTNFPTGGTIPVFTDIYTGFVVTSDSSPSPNTFATFVSVSLTGITVFGSRRTSSASAATTYNYLAIGR